MNPLTQTSSSDLRIEIFSRIPPKKFRYFSECSSGLKNSALVSKAWNEDAKYTKQRWVDENFISLKTYGGFKTIADLTNFIVLNKIKHVNFFEYSDKGNFLLNSIFEKCNDLQSLNLEFTDITDFGLTSIIKKSTTLQLLNLQRNVISNIGLAHIVKKCPNLLSLFIGSTHQVTGDGLPSILENCPNLQELGLHNKNITNDHLSKILEKCVKLKSINLSFNPITEAGLVSIFKNCQDLTSLNLTSIKEFTDSGLASIFKKLPKLQSLILDYLEVSDDGFTCIEKNNHLQSLGLWKTKITDAGIANILEKCPGLLSLDLQSLPENVTDRGLANIKEKYPNLQLVLGDNCAYRVNKLLAQPSYVEVSVEFDTGYGNSLVLCGNGGGLSWDPSQGLPLKCTGESQWTIRIPSDAKELKLVLKEQNGAFKWEKLDGNRSLGSKQLPLKPKF